MRPGGASRSSSLPRAARVAREVSDKTDILRKVARVFEEEQLEDKPQAFDALLTAFEMDFSDMDTIRYLERMAQATNRWPELVQTVNGWLQQTAPLQKITLWPAPRQVVRGGPRPPRVRPAVPPADPRARPEQQSPCCARWRTSSRRPASGSGRGRC